MDLTEYLIDLDLSLNQQIQAFEIKLIESYLSETGGCVAKAAKLANTPERTMWNKINKYKIDTAKIRGVSDQHIIKIKEIIKDLIQSLGEVIDRPSGDQIDHLALDLLKRGYKPIAPKTTSEIARRLVKGLK